MQSLDEPDFNTNYEDQDQDQLGTIRSSEWAISTQKLINRGHEIKRDVECKFCKKTAKPR